MRLPQSERTILGLLVARGPSYGLELVQASRGTLKRGGIYVTLGRMEEKGYIVSRLEDAPPAAGGLPRRIYAPTAFGRDVMAAWTTVTSRFRMRFAR